MKAFCAKAPGKLVIAGEYAVLQGYPALAMAVDKLAVCQVSASPGLHVSSNLNTKTQWFYQSGRWCPDRQTLDQALVSAVFQSALQEGLEIPPAHFHLDTTAFYRTSPLGQRSKLGLGSSSAIIVALSAALLHLNHQPLDKNRLFALALKAHRSFSRSLGSGIDIAVACFGGSIRFQNLPLTPLPSISPWSMPNALLEQLYYIDTMRSQNTRKFVERFLNSHHEDIQNILFQMNENTEMLYSHGAENYTMIFQALFELLASLGLAISCPIVNPRFMAMARFANACGGAVKPSGAGGGDIALAVIPRGCTAEFHYQLAQSNFALLPLGLEPEGARVMDSNLSNAGNPNNMG